MSGKINRIALPIHIHLTANGKFNIIRERRNCCR